MEENFANISRMNGGDGATYDSARAFADRQKYNETLRRQATYRNFDSSPSAGVISPEATAKFYQDRALATAGKTALNAVLKPTAMAIGAVAMAGGGQQASLMGAMVANAAVDKAERMVEQTSDYYRAKGAYDYGSEEEDKKPDKTMDLTEVNEELESKVKPKETSMKVNTSRKPVDITKSTDTMEKELKKRLNNNP